MTEAKEVEVEESCSDNPESVKNDLVDVKEIVTVGEKPTKDKEEAEKEIEEVDGAKEVDNDSKETHESKDEDDKVEKNLQTDSTDTCNDGRKEVDNDSKETQESKDEDDKAEKNLQMDSTVTCNDGRKELHVEVSHQDKPDETMHSTVDAVENSRNADTGSTISNTLDDLPEPEVSLKSVMVEIQTSPEKDEKGPTTQDLEDLSKNTAQDLSKNTEPENVSKNTTQDPAENNDVKLDVCDSLNQPKVDDEPISSTCAGTAPKAESSPLKVDHMEEDELKNESNLEESPVDAEDRDRSNLLMFDMDSPGAGEAGTKQEQAAFILELVKFHKERSLDFKPPKFYGEPLNLLKLWRSVLKLGGYDKVTACKYWRQVGESFKPPKTCTTVSWTFRIFYEKALLDYERYRTSTDGDGLAASLTISAGAENQAPGSGRARRDAAARAMQGWHSQRILDNGEVSDPIIKDKNSLSLSKKEKPLKSLGGILKRKKPSSPDATGTAPQMKVPRTQSDATVIDIGSPADWVKINVRATRDCYEVYALVPGLLREEVRVQSDPAGRLVISGEPENPDNPWNVTPFKKVVSLPSRIDPHQTSAVVTLHGQLFVRVPFEQYE